MTTDGRAAGETPTAEEHTAAPLDSPSGEGVTAPTPVPEHAALLRHHLERGQVGLAKKAAEPLLGQYPSDPWILADAGYANGFRDHERGDQLLTQALELATDASLRAQIYYYQGRFAQRRIGFRSDEARDLFTRSINEFPLAHVRRTLDLTQDEADEACTRRIRKFDRDVGRWNCETVEVGATTWLHQTQIFDEGELRVFHFWRLVQPAPKNREGLRWSRGDESMLDLAVCDGHEGVYLHGVFGGMGEVLAIEPYAWESEEYLLFRCRRDELETDSDGQPIDLPAAFYFRVCSTTTGWCTDEQITREPHHDGTQSQAKIEVRDGQVWVESADGRRTNFQLPG